MSSIRETVERLMEMSRNRKDILKKLADSEDQRVQNLMQIFIFRDMDTVHHWTSELYGVCHKTDKLKSNGKYLDAETILEEIWDSWEDTFYEYHNMNCDNISRKENLNIPKHSTKNMYGFIRDYHHWLSSELSSKGYITFRECEDIIKELLNEYPIN